MRGLVLVESQAGALSIGILNHPADMMLSSGGGVSGGSVNSGASFLPSSVDTNGSFLLIRKGG